MDTPLAPPPGEVGTGAESLVLTLRLFFAILGLVMAALFVMYLFSGMFIVPPDHVYLVSRFGRIRTDADGKPLLFSSGKLHFAFPKPIDTELPIKVGETKQVVSNQFWYKEQANQAAPQPGTQEEDHGKGINEGTDGYLITGDYNIMHTKWALNYRISDPYRWYTSFKDPEAVVVRVLENAVLQVVAQSSIEDALNRDIDLLHRAVKTRVIEQIGRMDLGVTVEEVSYSRRIPLRDVVADFKQVTSAQIEQRTKIEEAAKYRNKVVQEAEGDRNRIISEAQAYERRIVDATAADARYLEAILPRYQAAPQTMLLSLYNDALGQVWSQAQAVYTIRKNQDVWFRLNPEAVDPNSPPKPAK